jgi:hypothetical protein
MSRASEDGSERYQPGLLITYIPSACNALALVLGHQCRIGIPWPSMPDKKRQEY